MTGYADTGLTASTHYYYRVRATNTGGDSAYSNTASATTATNGSTIPSAPTNLSATPVSGTQINLAWTDNAGNETGFRVERSLDGVTFTQIATVGSNATTYANSGLSTSTTYYYRVRAYSNAGGNSAYSNTASAKTRSK